MQLDGRLSGLRLSVITETYLTFEYDLQFPKHFNRSKRRKCGQPSAVWQGSIPILETVSAFPDDLASRCQRAGEHDVSRAPTPMGFLCLSGEGGFSLAISSSRLQQSVGSGFQMQ